MITEILFTLTKTLLEKGFEKPIYIFMVSQNSNVVSAKYDGESTHVFVEHIEDPDWKLPINSFFVDGTGKSETIKLTEDMLKGYC
jgi:hypothetical protein